MTVIGCHTCGVVSCEELLTYQMMKMIKAIWHALHSSNVEYLLSQFVPKCLHKIHPLVLKKHGGLLERRLLGLLMSSRWIRCSGGVRECRGGMFRMDTLIPDECLGRFKNCGARWLAQRNLIEKMAQKDPSPFSACLLVHLKEFLKFLWQE